MLSRRACRQPSVVHHIGNGAERRFLARREPSALVHSFFVDFFFVCGTSSGHGA